VSPESPSNPYAGRWVARVRGKIVAQGLTAESAREAARLIRPKETPQIEFMMDGLNFPAFFYTLKENLPADAPPLYLVGGALRDALLGKTAHDLDFCLPKDARKFARQMANKLGGAYYTLDDEHDTARVILTLGDGAHGVLDFAAFRGGTLESDLRGRDFTINALALDVRTGELFDPLHGARDLREKVLRVCAPQAMTDDPVRVLRAVRLAAALGMSIQPETRKMAREAAPRLGGVSAERQRDELFKILTGPKADTAIHALDLLGALAPILPETTAMKGVEQSAPHVYDVWTHTLKVLHHLEQIVAALAPGYRADDTNDLFTGLLTLRLGRYREQFGAHLRRVLSGERDGRSLLFFAALYHDVEKSSCKTVEASGRIRFLGHDERGALTTQTRARALALSNDEIEALTTIVREHMRIHFYTHKLHAEGKAPTPRAIYRFFREAGEYGVDLVLLSLADLRATYEHTLTQEYWTAALDVCRTFLEAYWEKRAELVAPPILLNGNDLMDALALQPGRQIGKLLEGIRERQVVGQLSTRAEALAWARGVLDAEKLNLQEKK
jgi:tRNA nucleotidyltransferase/poly(A) polymerase